MTTVVDSVAPVRRGTLRQLARLETIRYARHPLFIIGAVFTVALCFTKPDPATSTYFYQIVPAAALGLFGLVTTASLTRRAHTLRLGAGAAPVPERTQTAALAIACLLPFAIGLIWFAWSVWGASRYPPPAAGFPFGPVSPTWKLAILFGEGALSTLGGPLLGIVIGRWLPRRGTAPLCAVLLVSAVIVMQGLFEPLRRIRVFMPFTYWGGPFGIEGDGERMLVFTGSPQWWCVYLLCLCGLAVVAALWHDPTARTPPLRAVGAVFLVAAVVTCLLAMFTGIGETLVNPLQSPL
jgi:hypothetical protein